MPRTLSLSNGTVMTADTSTGHGAVVDVGRRPGRLGRQLGGDGVRGGDEGEALLDEERLGGSSHRLLLATGRRFAAVDFAPHPKIPTDLSTVQIHTSANRGKVSDGILQRNPETGGVRLDFGPDQVANGLVFRVGYVDR